MTPHALLAHLDAGTTWPDGHGVGTDGAGDLDLDRAYAFALAVRALREARGERVAGIKLGWTNRANWPRMGIAAPMWSTLHETSIVERDAALPAGSAIPVALDWRLQPRLEPEVVVGLRATPPADADLEPLFDCLDWIAPGFEVVQSHLPDWRYTPAQTLCDGGVHARLVVGERVPVRALAPDGAALAERLARASVRVAEGGRLRGEGRGALVLGNPLEALRAGLREMARQPGAAPLRAGDLVTTGTWSDAFALAPGETWREDFDLALPALEIVLR